MKTQAAVFDPTTGQFDVEELELEGPKADEVLVRMTAAGVCHSDLHVIKGEWGISGPVVLGHEGSGVVEQVGAGVRHVEVGDHVVLSWVAYCGRCSYCLAGRPALCPMAEEFGFAGLMKDGTTRFARADGSPVLSNAGLGTFAELIVTSASSVVPISKDVPLEKAALIGCAVTTGVGAVVNTVSVQPGDSVLVVGCGGVGLSAILGAAAVSAGQIIAVDLNDETLELAETLGATATLNAAAADLVEQIKALTGGQGVDYAFEAIGLGATVEMCFEAIRPGGTAVVVGQAAEGVTIQIDPFVMSDREKRLVGSSYGSAHPAIDFPRFADLYRQGKLDLDQLVTGTCDLNDINAAFEKMRAGDTGRTLVIF